MSYLSSLSSICRFPSAFFMFFFFKQKTADEMRISDWSSDVCSSDLPAIAGRIGSARFFNEHLAVNIVCCPVLIPEHMGAPFALLRASPIIGLAPFTFCPGKRRKRLKTQGLIYILARITGAKT